MHYQDTTPALRVISGRRALYRLNEAFAMTPASVANTPDIPLAAKGMYAILAADWWEHDGECRLSLTELTKRAGCSRTLTIHLLKVLVEKDAITRECPGGRHENVYRPMPTSSEKLPMASSERLLVDPPLVARDYQTSSEGLPILVARDYQLPDSPIKGSKDVKKDSETTSPVRGGETFPQDVIDQLSRLPTTLDAVAFHAAAESALVDLGFSCQREVQVANRGDGRPGRLDLVGERGDTRIAFELDNRTPREKSITKLSGAVGCRFRAVVLRCPADGPLPLVAEQIMVIGAGRIDSSGVSSGGYAQDPKPTVKKQAKRGTACPETFTLTAKHYAYAAQYGYTEAQTASITEAFLGHHRFKGTVGKDWYAGWQGWIRRQREIDDRRPANGGYARTSEPRNLAPAKDPITGKSKYGGYLASSDDPLPWETPEALAAKPHQP